MFKVPTKSLWLAKQLPVGKLIDVPHNGSDQLSTQKSVIRVIVALERNTAALLFPSFRLSEIQTGRPKLFANVVTFRAQASDPHRQ